MDHGAVITDNVRRAAWCGTTILLAIVAMLAMPIAAYAAGATLVEPVDGHHFDHLERAPMVQFDPSKDDAGTQLSPKWVLLASDRAMTKTVRYCRQFVWASAGGSFHWGCNKWATGVDQVGRDELRALEEDTVYYWQVVSNATEGGGEVLSEVRSFAIDAEPKGNSLGQIQDKVYGTAFDDGTQLNLGNRAFVNSGVRVSKINSSRLAPRAYRIHTTHVGAIDYTRSYIKVKSKAGTRYLKVASKGSNRAQSFWRLTTAERRLKSKRFTYQAFLKSAKNGSLVRSQVRVVLIRDKKASRARVKPPVWTPDR